MLVLSRKLNESIVIDGNIRVTVVGIRGSQVRLGIEAPSFVSIFRDELCNGDANGREVASQPSVASRAGAPNGSPGA